VSDGVLWLPAHIHVGRAIRANLGWSDTAAEKSCAHGLTGLGLARSAAASRMGGGSATLTA